MRILVANKYLYPRGGDCIYTLRLMELLSSKGHDVIPFSMHHPQNIKTPYDRYFVPYIDFREELAKKGIKNALRVIKRAIVNTQAVELLDKLIQATKPDIIHLNNIHHQLTPAIIEAPAKRNIPIVWTLHDYTLNCPDSNFLRKGHSCCKCSKGNYLHAVIHRCKKGSFGASLIAAIECGLNTPAKLSRHVDKFICPGRFLANTMIGNGLDPNKVINIYNLLPQINIKSSGHDYFVYFGRLSEEKGVEYLIKAFIKLNKGKLVIVGDGPMLPALEKLANASKASEIQFIGHKPLEEVYKIVAGSLAVIVPSICWDNNPNAVSEAMAIGKPVIGSRIGGIPEQIDEGVTGMLFEPGNIDNLSDCLSALYNDKNKAINMGIVGQNKALKEYNAEKYYVNLMKVYEEVYDNHKRPLVNVPAEMEKVLVR